MNKTTLCLFGGALLGAGLCSTASADIAFDGALVQDDSLFGYDFGPIAYSFGYTTIDSWDFSVLSRGMVTFDMLSYQIFDTWIDSVVFLFDNDGNTLGSANFIAGNEDFFGSDINGSVHVSDSFFDVFLLPGEYTVAVALEGTLFSDFSAGESVGLMFGTGGQGLPTDGQYHLDIYGDVAAVPTPGALVVIGLGGLLGARRRR